MKRLPEIPYDLRRWSRHPRANPFKPRPRLYTRRELAAELGVKLKTLHHHFANDFTAPRPLTRSGNGTLYYSLSDVQAWWRARTLH